MERLPFRLAVFTAGFVTATMTWNVFDGSLFSFHPIGMTLGTLFLMTVGILQAIHAREAFGDQRTDRLGRHMWIQIAAASAVCIGFLAIFSNKVTFGLYGRNTASYSQIRLGKMHFTTYHGKVKTQIVQRQRFLSSWDW